MKTSKKVRENMAKSEQVDSQHDTHTQTDSGSDHSPDTSPDALNQTQPEALVQGKWAGFTVRDIVFLAVCGALIVVFTAVTGPLHAIGIFGLPQMSIAIFFSFFEALGVIRVRKPGSATIIASVSALVLMLIRPFDGILAFVTAVLVELIVLAIFRNYSRLSSIRTVSAIMPVMMVPVQVVYNTLILRVNIASSTTMIIVVVAVFIGTIVLSALGSFFGVKVGRELIASGRLK